MLYTRQTNYVDGRVAREAIRASYEQYDDAKSGTHVDVSVRPIKDSGVQCVCMWARCKGQAPSMNINKLSGSSKGGNRVISMEEKEIAVYILNRD